MRERFEFEGTSTGEYRGGLYVTYNGREHSAVYLGTLRLVTSSIKRPVVPVAYSVFLLKIPLYAMQKFCINFFFPSCAINAIFMIPAPSFVQ